jgi:hypothetical protein
MSPEAFWKVTSQLPFRLAWNFSTECQRRVKRVSNKLEGLVSIPMNRGKLR